MTERKPNVKKEYRIAVREGDVLTLVESSILANTNDALKAIKGRAKGGETGPFQVIVLVGTPIKATVKDNPTVVLEPA